MSQKLIPRDFLVAPRLSATYRPWRVEERYALLLIPFYCKVTPTSFGKHVLTPSLALTSIAAATPGNWRVRYWDENLLQGPPPVEPFPQVVGISVHLTFAKRAYELAKWYRERGAVAVLGGLHVTTCPEEAAPHADAIVVGEGVQVWGQVLRDVEAGTLKKVYAGSYTKPYRDDPLPRRELLPRGSYLTPASILATRGCHNRCGFCYLSSKGRHEPHMARDVEQVVEELRGTGQPYAVFTDNNLGSRPGYLRELCRALRPLKMIWSGAVSIDTANDPSLVREMALAGCTGVFMGLESLDNENLKDAGKRSPRPDDYARRIRIFHDNGIQVTGSFVLGFDHDTNNVFARTVEWIESTRLECATLNILTPYPGTPLFERMEAEGRILHKNWDLYDTGHAVFRPRNMTPEELEAGYTWCYRELFSSASIWKRRPADWRAVAPYLAMAYFYKRSNRLWHLLIRHRLTSAAWRPLVEVSRWRQMRIRRRLEEMSREPAGAVGGVPALA